MRSLVSAAALLIVSACASESAPMSHTLGSDKKPPSAASSLALPSAQLQRVDPALVCMVNNQYMGKPQIPVAVDGKTYFGCCDMCKSKLERDAASRTATDPTSGVSVDKASAVIGRASNGSVLYFETADNLRRYSVREGT